MQIMKMEVLRRCNVLKVGIWHWYLERFQNEQNKNVVSVEIFIRVQWPNTSNDWIKICFLFTKIGVLCRKRSESMNIDHELAG